MAEPACEGSYLIPEDSSEAEQVDGAGRVRYVYRWADCPECGISVALDADGRIEPHPAA